MARTNTRGKRRWTPAEERLLGRMPDRVLAKKLGRTYIAVFFRRHLKRITFRKKWDVRHDKYLGKMSDGDVARKIGRGKAVVAVRRRKLGIAPFGGPHGNYSPNAWSPAELKMLGRISDKEIARRTGRSFRAVLKYREKHHIPKARCDCSLRYWTPREDALLGTRPAREIARQLKRTVISVKHRCQRLRRARLRMMKRSR
jgi:hypothetical protein